MRRGKSNRRICGALALCLGAVWGSAMSPAAASDTLLANGGYEDGWSGWNELWTRDTGAGSARFDTEVRHGGRQSLRVDHTGQQDWAVNYRERIPVEPLQRYELTGWVRRTGEGTVSLSVILYAADGQVIDWTYAARDAGEQDQWQLLRCNFLIPPGAEAITPRWVGYRPAGVWLDDVSLIGRGRLSSAPLDSAPLAVAGKNPHLRATVNPADAALSVTDTRTGRTWSQRPLGGGLIPVAVKNTDDATRISLVYPETAQEFTAAIRLDADKPELALRIEGKGDLPAPLAYPYPFETQPADLLIMPVNEGISYPVDDPDLTEMHYILYGGHGLCMAWYGVTDGDDGMMVLVETPDDAAVRVVRAAGRLCQAPQWQGQKGQFGYPRDLRYIFFDDGGYVAMAKRYRAYAQQIGLFKTLTEKASQRPALDKLIGAVNVWCWQSDAPAICREMQSLGIDRILWSNRRPPDELRQLNEMGVLTSRYDIYQDVMNPANFDRLRGVHGDWPTEAWPQDLQVLADGSYGTGWRVRGKQDEWYACNVLCDARAVDYARRRLAAELKTHPYQCRFIDTTTASPWRECYSPDHPMTRSQSKDWKMKLLQVVSGEFGLVCGSETGHDAAVPYVDYFEGMLSLGPYRVPDAGRNMARLWDEIPPRVATFQTGHYYRLPLWELVYHDCVVAGWYWGDYNNKLPGLWDRRDLINALYATPPMFMFDRRIWDRYRDRFVQSYRATGPLARRCGYHEMLDHRWLTADHAVQRTRFANGVTITVNFGSTPHRLEDGFSLEPLSKRILDDNNQLPVAH
ncbi:MAG: carbohydrate binding domain-containing protein [Sedimentisphaerales bacterium]|nr:carbohydrate binding domain-containing protein [Sedimentisphaerales bacterium]